MARDFAQLTILFFEVIDPGAKRVLAMRTQAW